MTDDGDLIGTVLDGRWKVLELLGEGGMGAVYRARHHHLGTDVAIKVLRDSSDAARFHRESELIGRLNHDHIIRVQDTGKTPSGDDFFVMEYLRGPNLRRLLHDHGPLPWARTRVIVLQVCDALSALHSSRVIHRDLKLQNIVLDPRRGHRDFVKLLDFGVAKSLDQPRLTQTGIVLGTLPYMAPEYLLGAEPDDRVDIYALGLIAFELLTNRPPLLDSAANLKILKAHGVPASAQTIILRAMMRDPTQRFSDAETLAAALAASPDEDSPSLDEGTTTRFVGPNNGVSTELIDAGRTPWPPSGGPHALESTVITGGDNNGPPPMPPPLMSQAPLPESSPERPEGEKTAKLPEAMASPVRPSAAPKLSTRALYLLIVASTLVMVYLFLPDQSRPEPAIRVASGEPRESGTGLRNVGTNAAYPPGGSAGGSAGPDTTGGGSAPEATATGGPTPDATATGGVADLDATATGGPAKDGVDASVTGGPVSEPPPPPQPMTGRRSYMRRLSEMKRVVKNCKVVGAEQLELSIVIDGPSGKAEVNVLGPKLVMDEPEVQCAVKAIAQIRFSPFVGTYSPGPTLFDLEL